MKKIVITGGANGIGLECVRKFQSFDYLVFVLDKDLLNIDNKKNIIYYNCDISDYNVIKKCADDIYNQYGKIDIIINCASIQNISSFDNYNYNEWLDIFNTNYFGTCNTIHSFINNMNEQSTILNILSVHSSKPRKNKYAYDSSKSAVEQLTKELALEFVDKGITINALSFGAVNTKMNNYWNESDKEKALSHVPLKIIFEPNEIANFIYEIIVNFSKYTTGSIFTIDGGRSLT